MDYRGHPANRRGRRKKLKKSGADRPEEIYLECPGCGKQYLLQEEETYQVSLTCLRCGLIILL